MPMTAPTFSTVIVQVAVGIAAIGNTSLIVGTLRIVLTLIGCSLGWQTGTIGAYIIAQAACHQAFGRTGYKDAIGIEHALATGRKTLGFIGRRILDLTEIVYTVHTRGGTAVIF
jgi:hypothetical protein